MRNLQLDYFREYYSSFATKDPNKEIKMSFNKLSNDQFTY